MTLKYLGIHPESAYRGKQYEKHLHHTEIVRGREVAYYEVIEIEDVNTKVTLSNVRSVNKLSFSI